MSLSYPLVFFTSSPSSCRGRWACSSSLPTSCETQTCALCCYGEPGPTAEILQWEQRSRVLVQKVSLCWNSIQTVWLLKVTSPFLCIIIFYWGCNKSQGSDVVKLKCAEPLILNSERNPLIKKTSLTFACRALQVTRKVDILTPLGALYYNTGRYEEALQVYREAAALQPNSADIWLALVSAHTHINTHTNTLTESVTVRTSGWVYGLGKLPHLGYSPEQHMPGLEHFAKPWQCFFCFTHTNINTHSFYCFFSLQAQVLAMAGRTKEAEKMTQDIISREGSCIECYRLLSAIYSKRGNYTEVCALGC